MPRLRPQHATIPGRVSRTAIALVLITVETIAQPPTIYQTWTVNENIVNYYRPWNASERGGAVRADYTRYAVLVNNTMPGPSITATVNQTVDITVINHLMSDSVAIHWHGIRQTNTPWSDGADHVSQCPVQPAGGSTRYVFTADRPGTFFWHSHVGLQMDLGPVGALVVRDPDDPHRSLYDEELSGPILVHEWYRDPVSMLKAPGFRNYNVLELALVNGQWGGTNEDLASPASNSSSNSSSTTGIGGAGRSADNRLPLPAGAPGTAGGPPPYSLPVFEVAAGRCTRLRFINAMGDFPGGWQVWVEGHNLTVIALDAGNLAPTRTSSFTFYGGNRVDAVLCADQGQQGQQGQQEQQGQQGQQGGPGPTEFRMVFATTQQRAPDCPWYPAGCQYRVSALLRYVPAATASTPQSMVDRTALAALPYVPAMDVMRRPADWMPLRQQTAPPPTSSYRIKIGFLAQDGPAGTPAFAYVTKRPFAPPTFPPLFAAATAVLSPGLLVPPIPETSPAPTPTSTSPGGAGIAAGGANSNSTTVGVVGGGNLTEALPCGLQYDSHMLTVVSSSEVVELVLDNLSDVPHNMHLHGGAFLLVGSSGVRVEAGWLGDVRSPVDVAAACGEGGSAEHSDQAWLAKDPATFRRMWGCPFPNTTAARAALANHGEASPLPLDTVVVPPRGWAVIRLADWHPGVWSFHCHTNHHMLRGMAMLINALPQQRPRPPPWVDAACGQCAVDQAVQPLTEELATQQQVLDDVVATLANATVALEALQRANGGVAGGGAGHRGGGDHKEAVAIVILAVVAVVAGVAAGVACTRLSAAERRARVNELHADTGRALQAVGIERGVGVAGGEEGLHAHAAGGFSGMVFGAPPAGGGSPEARRLLGGPGEGEVGLDLGRGWDGGGGEGGGGVQWERVLGSSPPRGRGPEAAFGRPDGDVAETGRLLGGQGPGVRATVELSAPIK